MIRLTRRGLHNTTYNAIVALLLAAMALLTFAPPLHAQGCVPLPPYAVPADRIGINVVTDYGKSVIDYDTDPLGAGWFVDYRPYQYAGRLASAATVSVPSTPASAASVPVPSTPASAASAPIPPAPASAAAPNTIMLPLVALQHLAVPATPTTTMLPLVASQQLDTHDMGYAHVLRTTDLHGDWRPVIGRLVDEFPGMLWLIGNEPDRRGLQDDETPGSYARLYHDAYEFLKQRDPSARVAVGAIVQPTPIRLRYLDMVLAEYQRLYGAKLPTDAWNIHAFILREVAADDPNYGPNEKWGAGIPPGLDKFGSEGIPYEVWQHGDIEILKQFVRDFRAWMHGNGYRNTPLIISEYGILMRPDYWASPDGTVVYDYAFVTAFMSNSFKFFLTAKDPVTGYPDDGNLLVQSWAWYALNTYTEDPNPNDGLPWQQLVNGYLVDHDSGEFTPLGHDFARYTAGYGSTRRYVDLAFRTVSATRASVQAGVPNQGLTVDFSVYNRGNVNAVGTRIHFWLGEPGHGGKQLAEHYIPSSLDPRCRNAIDGRVVVDLPVLPAGAHQITVTASRGGPIPDLLPDNNRATLEIQAVN